MVQIYWLLFVVPLLLPGCKTVEVPLGAVMVGRPHTLGSNIGLRLTLGTSDQPKVQGTVDEVKDRDGDTINPLMSESYQDGKEVMPVYELGIGFLKRAEIDVSSHRGLSLMYDFYRDEQYTSSISISRASYSVGANGSSQNANSKRNRSNKMRAAGEADSSFSSTDNITGKSANTNVTLLGSTRFGDQVWAQLSLYTGIGLNQMWVEITNNSTQETKTKSQLAPSALVGIQGKLAIFELSVESAGIQFIERTGKKKWVPLFLASISTRFDWFGEN